MKLYFLNIKTIKKKIKIKFPVLKRKFDDVTVKNTKIHEFNLHQ